MVTYEPNQIYEVWVPNIVTPKNSTVETSPCYLLFTSTYEPGTKKHFSLQVDNTSNTFGSIELSADSLSSQTNWEYWNGGSWVAIPAAGVDSAYFGNNIRYSATLTDGNKWWRVREIIQ